MYKSVSLLGCFCLFAGMPTMAGQDEHRGEELSVSLSHVKLEHSSLSFDWKIRNSSVETLYVYSTFLKGPSADIVGNESGVLKVRTSLGSAESVGVNAYPLAQFQRVEPSKSITGHFLEKKLDRKILKGGDAVEFEVAFGGEVDEVKRQIAVTSRNGQHPANPIVAWQTQVFGTAQLSK